MKITEITEHIGHHQWVTGLLLTKDNYNYYILRGKPNYAPNTIHLPFSTFDISSLNINILYDTIKLILFRKLLELPPFHRIPPRGPLQKMNLFQFPASLRRMKMRAEGERKRGRRKARTFLFSTRSLFNLKTCLKLNVFI